MIGPGSPCIENWRQTAPAEIADLLSAETAVWRALLDWDVRVSWRKIEPARAAGMLPGFIARNDQGQVTGWCWFLLHQQCLQVGALISIDEDTTAALVRAIRASDEAKAATAQVWSVRAGAPGIERILEADGVSVARYQYLSAPLDESGEPIYERAWRRSDILRAADLCARAYAGADVRPFAPHGTLDEWRRYVTSLFDTDGCGTVLPRASFMIEDDENGPLLGAIVVSTIAPGVVHLAQIAVSPDARGVGIGKYLLRGAMSTSAWHGAKTMTLMVAENNVPAGKLYLAEGFTPRALFVVATSVQAPVTQGSTSRRITAQRTP